MKEDVGGHSVYCHEELWHLVIASCTNDSSFTWKIYSKQVFQAEKYSSVAIEHPGVCEQVEN